MCQLSVSISWIIIFFHSVNAMWPTLNLNLFNDWVSWSVHIHVLLFPYLHSLKFYKLIPRLYHSLTNEHRQVLWTHIFLVSRFALKIKLENKLSRWNPCSWNTDTLVKEIEIQANNYNAVITIVEAALTHIVRA